MPYVNDHDNLSSRGSNLYVSWEREHQVFTKLVMFTVICLHWYVFFIYIFLILMRY